MRRGSSRPPRPSSDEPRVNGQIRARRILLIDEEGRKLGEFQPNDAVARAQEAGLDLVEVSPNADPPVCKIMDYGKFKYEKSKRDREGRKNQATVTTKEIRLRPKTDEHDIAVKVKSARKFLGAGNKVKITIRFRGREHAHRDIGSEQCYRIADEVKDLGVVEAPPRMDGRQMVMVLTPK